MMQVEYAQQPPGRCYCCKGKLQKVFSGAHRGLFAFVRARDEIDVNDVVLHRVCAENWRPRGTAHLDYYAAKRGTARKPTHL